MFPSEKFRKRVQGKTKYVESNKYYNHHMGPFC